MTDNNKYSAGDLVAVVWPRQSAPAVQAGLMTWEEAAREAWAMERAKADRVRVLAAVHDDEVVGVWGVSGATHETTIPEGKSRAINRARFATEDDPRLGYLQGARSWLPRRRNPQSTHELRDLPGAQALLASKPPADHGLARVGAFALTVLDDGVTAELKMPAGGTLKVITS